MTVSGFEHLIGQSDMFRQAVLAAEAVARGNAPIVQIIGEPGTGKRGFAHGIHRCSTQAGPVVRASGRSLDPVLLQQELFGAPSMPGLLSIVDGGTLVLERADMLSAVLIGRVANAIVTGEATSADGQRYPVRARLLLTQTRPDPVPLDEPAEVARITVPPLRRRGADLDLLADHIVADLAPGDPPVLTPGARFAMAAHTWPGNVRELQEALIAARTGPAMLDVDDLVLRRRASALQAIAGPGIEPDVRPSSGEMTPGASLEDVEEQAIRATLHHTQGNRSAAARTLGVSRPTLLRKIRKYGID